MEATFCSMSSRMDRPGDSRAPSIHSFFRSSSKSNNPFLAKLSWPCFYKKRGKDTRTFCIAVGYYYSCSMHGLFASVWPQTFPTRPSGTTNTKKRRSCSSSCVSYNFSSPPVFFCARKWEVKGFSVFRVRAAYRFGRSQLFHAP